MRPRIIKRVEPDAWGESDSPRRRTRATVVIADSGTEAEVLVFAAGEDVAAGSEFRYRGTLWVVTGARRDSGVMVAEPKSHSSSPRNGWKEMRTRAAMRPS